MTDPIFLALKIIIPVFFIIRVFKVSLWRLDMPVLINALNYTLLLAGSFCLVEILFETLWSMRSGVGSPLLLSVAGNFATSVEPGWHTTIINRATGPYWFGFWLPVVINVLLPQLIWFKKVRKDVKLLYTWLVIASLLSLLISFTTLFVMLHRDYIPSTLSAGIVYSFLVSPTYFAISLISTLAVVAALYWLIAKKKKSGQA